MLRAMTCRHISRSKHRVKYLAWRDLRVRSRIECEICGLVRPPHPLPEQPVRRIRRLAKVEQHAG